MRHQKNILQNIDWMIVTIYLIFVLVGWFNIYAAVYNDEHKNIFDFTQNYGKQTIWIGGAILIALIILVIDGKFYAAFSYPTYVVVMISLVAVIFFGAVIKGSHSWFKIGNFAIQPAEFAKFATNMVLAKYLSKLDIRMQNIRTKIIAGFMVCLPVILILLQNETGSALVFTSFIFVLYREGLSGNFLILGFVAAVLFILALLVKKSILIGILVGIGLIFYLLVKKNRRNAIIIISGIAIACSIVFSVDYVYHHVLKEHQRTRIDVLLGKEIDLKGAGYNVNQSKIAIGSGGVFGKGYLQGTQTKYEFVPEQSTDFIFCTVGEEWGFVGSLFVIGLFMVLLVRIIYVAERQRSQYSRIYGYGVASILFFHLMVNIGMTIGLAPVIGIPLPFFSYGGSSLWSFTILLFIFVKLDAYRLQILR